MSWDGRLTPIGSHTASQSWVTMSDSDSLVSMTPLRVTSAPALRHSAARYSAAACTPAPFVEPYSSRSVSLLPSLTRTPSGPARQPAASSAAAAAAGSWPGT